MPKNDEIWILSKLQVKSQPFKNRNITNIQKQDDYIIERSLEQNTKVLQNTIYNNTQQNNTFSQDTVSLKNYSYSLTN